MLHRVLRHPGLAGILVLLLGALASGCARSSPRSIAGPAGPQAGHIDSLWSLLFWICTAVFAVVIAALVLAVIRHHPAPDTEALPDDARRRFTRVISVSVGLTVVLLAWIMGATLVAEARINQLRPDGALTVLVTGKQWWWSVEYTGTDSGPGFTTANEIHIPVGRPVHVRLFSADVIHSFWVPRLHGKRDMIPGRENSLWIQADEPGRYEGQCAEFCGHQHAHMRLLVIAQPEEEFQQWLAHQRSAARDPRTEGERRGQAVFLGSTCVMCHTVRGTTAGSRAGPDLTHVASRQTLASGTLPNSRGNLAGWILDPQGVKPGNHMPPHALPPEDLHALLDYLESLQ